MKCPNCSQENKKTVLECRKCGRDLSVPPAWFPDWRWHARTLGVIYMTLTVLYFSVDFALKHMPEPYQLRKIPSELTPWLNR